MAGTSVSFSWRPSLFNPKFGRRREPTKTNLKLKPESIEMLITHYSDPCQDHLEQGWTCTSFHVPAWTNAGLRPRLVGLVTCKSRHEAHGHQGTPQSVAAVPSLGHDFSITSGKVTKERGRKSGVSEKWTTVVKLWHASRLGQKFLQVQSQHLSISPKFRQKSHWRESDSRFR